MNPELEKIAERIRKLLALAGSPEEGEALAAAAKAQELLIRYGLTMAQVKAEPEEWSTFVTEPMPGEHWRAVIFRAAAQFNFCEGGFAALDDKQAIQIIFGKRLNIFVANQVALYLIASVERAYKKASADPLLFFAMTDEASFREAFHLAAAVRLGHRLEKMFAEAQDKVDAAPGRNLPALMDELAKVKAAFKEQFAGADVKQCQQASDPLGAALGLEAAEGISLAKQVCHAAPAPAVGHQNK